MSISWARVLMLAVLLAASVACGTSDTSTSMSSTPAPLQEFNAIPDFSNFGDCGHPCDLGVYPTPNPAPGTPSITVRYPLEASQGQKGDEVRVKCQINIPEKPVRNQIGAVSTVWNGVVIPRDKLTDAVKTALPSDKQEVIGYAPDMWLGNKGLRAPKCVL